MLTTMLTTIERAVLRRFVANTAIILALLAWLVLVVLGARALSSSNQLSAAGLLRQLPYLLLMLEFAVPVAAGLGLARTMLILRASGVLTTVMAAGFRTRRLRVTFGLAGLVSIGASIFLYECSQLLPVRRGEAVRQTVWENDQGFAWCVSPAGSPPQYLIFDRDSLQVSSGTAVKRGSSLSFEHLVTDRGVSAARYQFRPLAQARELRRVPSILGSPTAITTTSVVAWMDRFLWGGICVLLVGYLSLLLPASRSFVVYALVPLLAGASTAAFLRSSELVWKDHSTAVTPDAVVILVLLVCCDRLDRQCDRRGLRVA